MATHSRSRRPRRAAWLVAVAVLAIFAVAANAAADAPQPVDGLANDVAYAAPTAPTLVADPSSSSSSSSTPPDSQQQQDRSSEASRAYRHALATLSTLTALPSTHSHSPFPLPLSTPSGGPPSLLARILRLPTLIDLQGRGPLASAARIALKLRARAATLPAWLHSAAADARRNDALRARAVKVLDLLTHAADFGHLDALFTLAKISLLPPTPHFPSDSVGAFTRFAEHAAQTGNASSQAFLAFFHATGLHAQPVDQARAQLYYTFAAHAGDRGAQMALGYRAWSGIASSEDCMAAVGWYELAAEQAMAKFLSGPPGGRTLPLTPTRLSDLDGGVFGPGASVASTGLNVIRPAIKAARARVAGETWEDILEYYIFNADRGESDYMFRLGKIFYQGSIYSASGGIASGGEGVGRVPRDLDRARHYFERIARTVWPVDPADPLQHSTQDAQSAQQQQQQQGVGYAAAAAGYLGRMYLRGEGVRQDFRRARMWFERGAEHGDRESLTGLALVWRDGLVDGRRDAKRALAHFGAAAAQEHPEALVQLGKYHYQQGDVKRATGYFEAAVRHGSPFEAYYYLAQIHARSLALLPAAMRPGSCSMAASFFKVVAERGSWGSSSQHSSASLSVAAANDYDAPLAAGEAAWGRGARENALVLWMIAAERGHEAAQNNVAYVLDADRSMLLRNNDTALAHTHADAHADTMRANADADARTALAHWTRSAAQHNVDALVKVADYHYHGLGGAARSAERAAMYYRAAADTQVSALAMWNLGWMYENGVGVPQDFHLAKRHYDGALETNAEAYLPVTVALVKLYAKSLWHTLRGGSGGLSLWGPDEVGDDEHDGPLSSSTRVLDEAQDDDAGKLTGAREDDSELELGLGFEDDGHWYMGRAKEEFERRRRGPADGDDDDPIQWAYDRRREELDRDGDFGPEDYFDGATRGRRDREDGEPGDELFETTVLVGLCLVVSLLLYVRGRLVERLRREERQQQQQAQGQAQAQAQGPARDEGLFPPQGDPAREEWAVQR